MTVDKNGFIVLCLVVQKQLVETHCSLLGSQKQPDNLPPLFLLSSLVDAWSVAFSPDSKYIATGSHLGKVNIFGVESGKKEYSLDTRGKFILSIAYVRSHKLSFWSAHQLVVCLGSSVTHLTLCFSSYLRFALNLNPFSPDPEVGFGAF